MIEIELDSVYYMGVYSYGTKVTQPDERARRLARFDGSETLGKVLGINFYLPKTLFSFTIIISMYLLDKLAKKWFMFNI